MRSVLGLLAGVMLVLWFQNGMTLPKLPETPLTPAAVIHPFDEPVNVNTIRETTLGALISAAEVRATQEVTTIVDSEARPDSWIKIFGFYERHIITTVGRVDAVINLSSVPASAVQVDPNDGSVLITLPVPELDTSIDVTDSKVERESGFLPNNDKLDVLQKAAPLIEEKMLGLAGENVKIAAIKEAETFCTSLLQAAGVEHVRVVVRRK